MNNPFQRVLSEETITRLLEGSTQRVRRAISNRHRGQPQQGEETGEDSLARSIERAVLEALDADLQEARRFRAFKRRHGRLVLSKAFDLHLASALQVHQHIDQLAEDAILQPAPAEDPRPRPAMVRDIASEFPLLDLNLDGIGRKGA